MEISFKAQGNVQLVQIGGTLAETEAAAVRIKLEQKVNKGRFKILFDLENFDHLNDASRKLLLGIIGYALNRGCLIACSGIPVDKHTLYLIVNKQPKLFVLRDEGIDYLNRTLSPAQLAEEAKAKPLTKDEEELKNTALKKLLEKYEIFQAHDDDDPFRLGFVAEQYRIQPNKDALAIERKAREKLAALTEEIESLEAECEFLGAKVKTLMQFRKVPLNAGELQMKQSALTQEIDEHTQVIAKIKQVIEENKASLEVLKKEAMDARHASDVELKELEQKLADTSAAFKKELETLQTQDAIEEKQLEEAIKNSM